jgi:hypothetical protein
MAQIVRQAGSFNDLRMDADCAREVALARDNVFRDPAPDLGNLVSVLLARVKDVQFTGPNDLSYSGQPMESRRIQDLVAISREAISLIIYRNIELAVLSVRK